MEIAFEEEVLGWSRADRSRRMAPENLPNGRAADGKCPEIMTFS
jgi:hypothetical protein